MTVVVIVLLALEALWLGETVIHDEWDDWTHYAAIALIVVTLLYGYTHSHGHLPGL